MYILVKNSSQERISGQLSGRRDGERKEDVQAKRPNVSDVAIEDERDGHPDDDEEDGVAPQAGRPEQV